jgi:hypothetical protein
MKKDPTVKENEDDAKHQEWEIKMIYKRKPRMIQSIHQSVERLKMIK